MDIAGNFFLETGELVRNPENTPTPPHLLSPICMSGVENSITGSTYKEVKGCVTDAYGGMKIRTFYESLQLSKGRENYSTVVSTHLTPISENT